VEQLEPVHQVRISQEGGGPPIVVIDLGAALALGEVEALASQVAERVDGLAGVPFGLLIDTRAVKGAEQGATERLARLETDLAARGLLRIAHVVPPQALARMKPKLDAEYAALGHPDLIGTFDDPQAAAKFLSGEDQ
jgi:hypothetical protein